MLIIGLYKMIGTLSGEKAIVCETLDGMIFDGPFVRKEGTLKVVNNMRW